MKKITPSMAKNFAYAVIALNAIGFLATGSWDFVVMGIVLAGALWLHLDTATKVTAQTTEHYFMRDCDENLSIVEAQELLHNKR